MNAGNIRKPNAIDFSLLLLLAVVWASAFLAIKIVVPETGPLWLATLRVVIGFAVLLPFALVKGWLWPINAHEWYLVIWVMLLNVVVPFFLISWAEQDIDAGVASMLMGAGPFLALISSHFFTTDDKLSRLKIIGAALGFAGIAVLVGWEAFNQLGENMIGQAAVILASACYVTSGLLVRKLSRFPPIPLSSLVLAMASISLLLLANYFDGLPAQNFGQSTWLALIYLGVFPTGLGYVLRYYLVQKIGVSAFSTGLNLIPVFGVLLAALLLGEALSMNVLIALVFIVTGLFVIRRG